ncbi:MAG TPA: SAM-dependent methyltransferase [Nitrolancea sp.]|nr:SAM-dependent methyltransferase [Nitrolancea sp.]
MHCTEVIFSASEPYLPAAVLELVDAFPTARIQQLAPGLGRFEACDVDIAEVAQAVHRRPILFVQHLLRAIATPPRRSLDEDVQQVADIGVNLLHSSGVGTDIALQVWQSGEFVRSYRPEEIRSGLAERLTQRGFSLSRGSRDWILSVLITQEQVIVGFNRREDALVDWPGGRLSLAQCKDQISRSEFKLEELFKVVDLALPAQGVALDLGASPGGWTRILRQHGFTVWAVDPGALDPRVAADPNVHHAEMTAARYLAETNLKFDLVANDMRMTPILSSKLMLEAANRLKPGGLGIITLKITPHKPRDVIEDCFSILRRRYDIVFASQLFHNRNEVTVVVRRAG